MALILNELELRLRIQREPVDCDHAGQFIHLRDVLNMLEQVRDALFKSFQILRAKLGLRNAAIVLQRADSRYDNDCARGQACHAALNVKEFFRTEVCAEAGFRDGVIGKTHCNLCCSHGVTAVCDVRERAAMHECRRMLERLDEIRLQSIL